MKGMKFPAVLFLCTLWLSIGSAKIILTPIVSIKDISPTVASGRVRPLTSTVSEVDAIVGESVIFECNVLDLMGDKPILWKRVANGASITLNDGLKSLDSSKYRISQGTSQHSVRLELMSISHGSAGPYMCEVFYDDRSTEIRHTREVKVFEPPRFSTRDTSFETSASVGDSVSLKCGAEGQPQPMLYWYKSAGSSSVIRNYGRQVQGGLIKFDSVQSIDRGTYICSAVNRFGTSQWPVTLSVMFKPSVRFENGNTASQKVGCALELLCLVEANPVPDAGAIAISKDGNTLVTGRDGVELVYMRGADSTVYLSAYIYPFKQSHVGTYTCTATNNVKEGRGEASIQVTASTTALPGRGGLTMCPGCRLLASPKLQLMAIGLLLMLLHFMANGC